VLPNARPQPSFSTGLYHVAILMPTRAELGRVILNLGRTQYPVSGAADHLVSEALYLNDPDGNGLELYRDRPREEWRWNGTEVVMSNAPFDVDGIVGSVDDPDAPFAGMAAGTTVGHVHLRVGDIPAAEAFYVGVMGFDVVSRWTGALFVSAGGYHHHLGLNVWGSRNAPRPPADSVGLREYTLLVPDPPALGSVAGRLDAANISYGRGEGDLRVDDPWGNTIRVAVE
jgi:catechol 2,3-dioxygenase